MHTIFENIHAELEHKEKISRRLRIIGEVDTAREAELFRNMNATYKSGVKRFENQCYKINSRPVSLNEGSYRVNFEPVDAKVPTPALHKFGLAKAKKRFYKIAPCVMDGAACTYSSRLQGKSKYPQTFNAVM